MVGARHSMNHPYIYLLASEVANKKKLLVIGECGGIFYVGLGLAISIFSYMPSNSFFQRESAY